MCDLEKIKEKIKKLKALALDEAAGLGEVQNALKLAEQLCKQYNLVLSEIDETELNKQIKESITEKKIQVKHSKISIARSCNTAICKLYECETFYNYDHTFQTIIGIESDIELALYAIDIFHSAMDIGWKEYMKSEDYQDYIWRGCSRNQIRRDYNKGFALSVMKIVNAMIDDKEALKKVQTSKCTALVIRKEAEINEYKETNYPNLVKGKRRNVTLSLYGAVEAGEADGSRISFNKGIQSPNTITYKIGVGNNE